MEDGEMAIPHLFTCPISLDLIKDPVTLCTGQTYDRSSIEKWFAAGNLTCPVTMQRLHDPSMVPNHTLRHLIDQWLQMCKQIDPNYFKTTGNHDCWVAALKHNLESNESTLESKLQSLEQVQILSGELSSPNSCLIELGFFPLLLELVFGQEGAKHFRKNPNFVEKALVCALKLLPFCELRALNMLKQESALANFAGLFEHGSTTIKTSLCHLIEAASSSLETSEFCAVVGKSRVILHEILLLLHHYSEASEPGAKAISALCSMEGNGENLVREGAVDGLITSILRADQRHERSCAATSAATLEQLLGLESAKGAVLNHPNGVNALVKMVFRVSDHGGSESAINSLTIMCRGSLRAQEEAVCAGVLTQLLLLLQSQCSDSTKTKARLLLKLLKSKRTEEPKHV